MIVKTRKKLIEVALPLEMINAASAHEKMPGIGPHPRGIHLWWSRKPLATARATIFAQMVDDPSSLSELFPTAGEQQKERRRLFTIIEQLVQWENTGNLKLLQLGRDEIWQSWRRACEDNKNHPSAPEFFNPLRLPDFQDPFAGGGAFPLEAERLGLKAYAGDLNPVAVLINKAMIEIPPKFSGNPPVNPAVRGEKTLTARQWSGAQGLAEDVQHYGQWIRDAAEKRIGQLYPRIEVTPEMTKRRPDIEPHLGQRLTVIAWIWARTVKSPNPAFATIDVPLASTFMLSAKPGNEAYVEPAIEGRGYRFTVKVGKPKNVHRTKHGTKTRGANFDCLLSGTPITGDYVRKEAQAGRMGIKLMAIVAQGPRGRLYFAPTAEHEAIGNGARSKWKPDLKVPTPCHDVDRLPMYGMPTWGDAFGPRQLAGLTTFSDLIPETMRRVKDDAVAAGLPDDDIPLRNGGVGARAYAEAVSVYLAFAVDRVADFSNSLCTWSPFNQKVMHLFGKQSLPMAWGFAEANVLEDVVGGFVPATKFISECIKTLLVDQPGVAIQEDATKSGAGGNKVISTDPPYYDNVSYAVLSDFFYVWLRCSLGTVFPDLFTTIAVPKADELIAAPYRQGSREKAQSFFLAGMTEAMHRLAEQAHPAFPVTVYYAFKQSENRTDAGTVSTGWEAFLAALIGAGFIISGTWPMRSEQEFRMLGMGTNALASSIVLVCRPRAANALTVTRRGFVAELKSELPGALYLLQAGNIAPVDLAQAAIGPGMAIFTRYSKVLDAEGKQVSVREALALINQTLDEVLAEQEGDFDADTRWALVWFEQHGFAEGEFGVAEQLSKAKNTSVQGLTEATIVQSKRGKVRLLKPVELQVDWDPATDTRLTAWEMVHQLIRALDSGGETAAASLVAKLGSRAEVARELAYRLYTIAERRKLAPEALGYNGLVQSWPEIADRAREGQRNVPAQADLFETLET
jgi:putative DNA methylase